MLEILDVCMLMTVPRESLMRERGQAFLLFIFAFFQDFVIPKKLLHFHSRHVKGAINALKIAISAPTTFALIISFVFIISLNVS